ncbi:MAG: hypothetical protein IT555_17130, partial [Acetobacteraceae bacterium]|nr:hypothetical protein [Acetobacteraceae bacterium]
RNLGIASESLGIAPARPAFDVPVVAIAAAVDAPIGAEVVTGDEAAAMVVAAESELAPIAEANVVLAFEAQSAPELGAMMEPTVTEVAAITELDAVLAIDAQPAAEFVVLAEATATSEVGSITEAEAVLSLDPQAEPEFVTLADSAATSEVVSITELDAVLALDAQSAAEFATLAEATATSEVGSITEAEAVLSLDPQAEPKFVTLAESAATSEVVSITELDAVLALEAQPAAELVMLEPATSEAASITELDAVLALDAQPAAEFGMLAEPAATSEVASIAGLDAALALDAQSAAEFDTLAEPAAKFDVASITELDAVLALDAQSAPEFDTLAEPTAAEVDSITEPDPALALDTQSAAEFGMLAEPAATSEVASITEAEAVLSLDPQAEPDFVTLAEPTAAEVASITELDAVLALDAQSAAEFGMLAEPAVTSEVASITQLDAVLALDAQAAPEFDTLAEPTATEVASITELDAVPALDAQPAAELVMLAEPAATEVAPIAEPEPKGPAQPDFTALPEPAPVLAALNPAAASAAPFELAFLDLPQAALALPAFLGHRRPCRSQADPESAFLALPMPEPEFVELAEPTLAAAPVAVDPPASVHIYPLAGPEAHTAVRRMRKPRTREIFFSTPRLHDLPALAATVARTNQEATLASPGSLPWNAILLATAAPRQAASTALPNRIVAVDPVETASTAALPLLSVPPSNVRLRWDSDALAAISVPLSVPAPPSLAEVVLVCESWNSDVQEPALAAAVAPALTLVAAGLEAMPALAATVGDRPLLCTVTPNPSDETQPAAPQAPNWTPARPATGVRASSSLLPVQPSGNGGERTPRTAAPEFEPLAGASSPATVYPAINGLRPGGPPLVKEMWPVQPGNPLPYPAGTVAVQNLEAAWPEGNAQLPRLACDIAPDRVLRERPSGKSGFRNAAGGRSWIPNGFSLANLSMPARPDLKWLVMLVPVGLLLAVYSLTSDGNKRAGVETAQVAPPVEAAVERTTASVAVTPASGSKRRRKLAPMVEAAPPAPVAIVPAAADPNASFSDGVKASIMRRAAISFTDDFRTGLADWQGGDNWSTQWSYDAAGFLNTGPLALYSPSMSLSIYRVEVLGQIERKSLGWVFRAKDLKNYYVTKITLVRGGPLPTAMIERYVVLDGKESRHERRPLPLQIRTDTLYRVKLDVNGEDFTLTVQGQLVDHWCDSR